MSIPNSGISNESLNLKTRGYFEVPLRDSVRNLQRKGAIYYDSKINRLLVSKGKGLSDAILAELGEGGAVTGTTGTIIEASTSTPGGTPQQGTGTLWVRDDNPTVIIFTDDDGTEYILNADAYSAETRDLYISQATGDDANDGLTALTPVQTFGRLQSIAALYNIDEIVVHLYEGETYTGWESASSSPFNYKDVGQYTNIIDLSAFGAGTIRFITDISVDANTPNSTATWEPVVGMNSLGALDAWIVYNHNAISTATTDRFMYIPSLDRYTYTDTSSNTATETYAYARTAGVLSTTEYYDNTQMGVLSPASDTAINAGGKNIVFERVNTANTPCCFNGNFNFRGSTINNLNAMADVTVEGCNTSTLSADALTLYYSKNSNVSQTGSVNYDTSKFEVLIQSHVKANQSVIDPALGYLQNCTGIIDTCAVSSNPFYFLYSPRVFVKDLFALDTRFIVEDASVYIENPTMSGAFTVQNNASLTVIGGTVDFSISGQGIQIRNDSDVYITSSLSDSAGATNGLIFVDRNSKLRIIGSNTFNTTRVGSQITVLSGSKVGIEGDLTFSNTLTSFNGVLFCDNAEFSITGLFTADDTIKIIQVGKTGVVKFGATPINNNGANVIGRGTSAVTAFIPDTTGYSGVAADEMTLVLQI